MNMAREIELKAKIPDPKEIIKKISAFAVFLGNFEREDSYWYPEKHDHGYGVRVRKEKFQNVRGESAQKTCITWKKKEVRGNIEHNDENEFEVSSAPVFEEFMIHLGYKPGNFKHKKGSSFKYGNMTIEVTEVEKLGWFIELELLFPQKEGETEIAAPEQLLLILDKLGIKRDSIESRPYTQLILLNNPGPD